MTVPPSFRESVELIDAIWGPYGSDISLRDKRLKALIGNAWSKQIFPRDGYFNVVAQETWPTKGQKGTTNPSIRVIVELIRVLKSNPQVPRYVLESNGEVRGILQDTMLDRALSIMLMTKSIFPETSHEAIFNPRWKMNESLESFIHRVYDNPQDHYDDHSPIDITKLSVAYFRRWHVQIEIAWTGILTDHLILSNNKKTLHVFKYPGFLQTGLKALPPEQSCDGVASALRRGCLPYKLLAETMWTYDIIFPQQDRVAQQWLKKQLIDHKLDTMLSRRPRVPQIHESPKDIDAPEDVSSLCDKYPYWGERLYRLWKEVNEPSPVESRFEACARPLHDWSRANPSISWLSGVISVCVTQILGLWAAVFAALQFLVSRDGSLEAVVEILKSCVNKIGTRTRKYIRPTEKTQEEDCELNEEDRKAFEKMRKICKE